MSIYASVLLVIPEIITSPFSYFFPRRLLPDWISSIIGFVVPVFGLVVYAVNDRIFDQSQIVKCSGFYDLSRNGVFASWKTLMKTIINASLSGLAVTLLGLALFDFGTYKDGGFFGWFTFGNMVTFGILLLLFMRFFSISNTFSFFLFLLPVALLVVYFFLWVIMSSVSGSSLFDTFLEVALSPQFYLFLGVVIGLGLAEYLWLKIQFFSLFEDLKLEENFTPGGKPIEAFDSEMSDREKRKGFSHNQQNLMMDDYKNSDSD